MVTKTKTPAADALAQVAAAVFARRHLPRLLSLVSLVSEGEGNSPEAREIAADVMADYQMEDAA